MLTAEAHVGDSFRYVDFAKQITVRSVAAHAVLIRIAPAHGAPDTPLGIAADPIGNTGLGHIGKYLAVGRLAARHIEVEHADVRGVVRPVREAGVADIELFLVRGDAKPVRLDEIIDDDLDLAGFRIDAVDVVLRLLGFGLDAS